MAVEGYPALAARAGALDPDVWVKTEALIALEEAAYPQRWMDDLPSTDPRDHEWATGRKADVWQKSYLNERSTELPHRADQVAKRLMDDYASLNGSLDDKLLGQFINRTDDGGYKVRFFRGPLAREWRVLSESPPREYIVTMQGRRYLDPSSPETEAVIETFLYIRTLRSVDNELWVVYIPSELEGVV